MYYRELSKILSKEVFSILGSNLSESVYRNALCYELFMKNIPYNMEVVIPIMYKKHQVGYGRADIIIDNKLILELKAVATKPGINEKNNTNAEFSE